MVLPFVPVTATKRLGSRRQASSSSPITGSAASPSLGDRGRGAWHPGALDYAAHPLDDFRSIPIQENFDVVPR